MRNRRILFNLMLAALLIVGIAPLVASAGTNLPAGPENLAQEAPTATPTDPGWLAFSVARAAIEEAKSEDLTWVSQWTYEESEWTDGIDGCRTLDAETGEQARQVFFGWTVTMTSLYGRQYQARVSFNYKLVSVCDEVVQTTVTTTEANPDPNLVAPVAGTANNGSFELGGQVTGLYADAVATAKSAGMTWVKMQLYAGRDDGSGYIAEAHANGLKILFSVIGDKSQVMNSSYHDTYAAYVGGLAAAGADAIEVWNEMNIEREWPEGQINGANYVPLLAKAFNAIKSANPNTLVITGAPSPTGAEAAFPGKVVNDDNYMAQMAQAGAANYADCIGVHYNEGTTSPNASSGAAQDDNYPTRYFGPMLNRALQSFGGKQACFTELGYVSPEGYGALPGTFAWGAGTSIAEQAQWLAEAAVLSANSGRVRLMIVFNVNFTFWDPSDPQAGYAIMRADGSCPACATLASVMQ